MLCEKRSPVTGEKIQTITEIEVCKGIAFQVFKFVKRKSSYPVKTLDQVKNFSLGENGFSTR
jgi:hypothetical protein